MNRTGLTQAQLLYRTLRARPYGLTYGELQRLGVSTCPHKRLAEGVHYLKEGESLVRIVGSDGLVRIRLTRKPEQV
jgi:hypothetical protein